jgi:hypothetical protein
MCANTCDLTDFAPIEAVSTVKLKSFARRITNGNSLSFLLTAATFLKERLEPPNKALRTSKAALRMVGLRTSAITSTGK